MIIRVALSREKFQANSALVKIYQASQTLLIETF